MALYMQSNDVSAKRTGVVAKIPNNDVARLMYYMQCVCTAINCDNDPDMQRFTNYNTWARLSTDEQKLLIVACAAASPDILNNLVFFHSDELCGNSRNEFYTIKQVRNQVLAAESIIIAGQQRVVNKIMTYKMSWMETYYINPMRRLVARFSAPPPLPPPPPITYTSPTYRQPSRAPTVVQPKRIRRKPSCCCRCCLISIVLLILIIGIGIGVYFILRQRGII
jgi:hypothetical protein